MSAGRHRRWLRPGAATRRDRGRARRRSRPAGGGGVGGPLPGRDRHARVEHVRRVGHARRAGGRLRRGLRGRARGRPRRHRRAHARDRARRAARRGRVRAAARAHRSPCRPVWTSESRSRRSGCRMPTAPRSPWPTCAERPVLLVNWSPRCGFCTLIAPELAELQPELHARGVEMVFITLGDAEENRPLLEEHGLQPRVLVRRRVGRGGVRGRRHAVRVSRGRRGQCRIPAHDRRRQGARPGPCGRRSGRSPAALPGLGKLRCLERDKDWRLGVLQS